MCFVALGDSTTVGIGDPITGSGWRGWARLLAAELARTHQLTYANLSVSGATCESLRADQLHAALRARPHIASVIVGVNDTMRSTWDPARVHDDILSSVGALTDAGALVMTLRFHDHGRVLRLPALLRRPLLRRIEAINAAYDAAYASHGGIRIDLTDERVVHQREFWSVDRLHPSELGHRWLACEFAVGLRARGFRVGCPDIGTYTTPLPWQNAWWMVSEGIPWLGRRANDVLPWAMRMAATEVASRVRGGRAERGVRPALRTERPVRLARTGTPPAVPTHQTADTHAQVMSESP
ncbi:MAG: SGNH/GDSL hydrolase family protein [Actinophytocola sp.]|nr:SGNH/GDSL hydrolase family protein [Actinophytocola sp.]